MMTFAFRFVKGRPSFVLDTPMFTQLNSFVLSALLCATAVAAEPQSPNIVVILVDDMGYGDLSCFNSESKITTPHIDSLAREGMRFTDAHAPGPLCHMSRYGLMTGRYPFRTDVTVWPTQPLIAKQQMTIASLAKSQGYRTAMVGKWHLGFKENGYDKPLAGGPVDCGFDSYFGMRASTDIPPYFYIRGNQAVQQPTNHIDDQFSDDWSKIQGLRRLAGGIAPDMKLEEVLPRFTDEAVKVIRNHGTGSTSGADSAKPLMLYLAYPAPHTPWLPAKEFIGKSGASLYGDFVMMVDAQVGRVLAALKDAGLDKDTLVVFTSDNGPCWHDADTKRLGHDSTGGLRGMKSDAWEGGHRMPLIVRWPGQVKGDSESGQLVCFTDLLATFADAMGVDLPANAGPDSFSFLPALKGLAKEQPESAGKPVGDAVGSGSSSMRDTFVMRAGSLASMMTIRSGDWKLITGLGSGGFSKPKRIQPVEGGPTGQLYNLIDDRNETNNLYLQHPEIVARLTAEMKTIVDQGRSRVASHPALRKVDRSTLTNKVMVGYQGWFNCETDGADLGWTHWSKDRKKMFGPGNVTVDLWPDMSELDDDERFATGFTLKDGSVAEVFSSAHRKTVTRHFKWMRDYGIDGAFLQRFAHGLKNKTGKRHKDAVLQNVRDGAKQNGRSYAVMYDLTGLPAGGCQIVRDDWSALSRGQQITKDAAYQRHAGKPVVAIWGVGFNDGNKSRNYSLSECRELIEFLKADGCTVMLGVPSGWRKQERDATADRKLHDALQLADILSPWTVGRYRDADGVKRHGDKFWQPDIKWCADHNLDYVPVVFPGFSWHNLHGEKLGAIPRMKGEFLWSQISAAKRAGCDMLYVAMFDEVDEATAIFKCTNNPPIGEDAAFLTYEGLPSDHYLKLVGKAGKLLRGELEID